MTRKVQSGSATSKAIWQKIIPIKLQAKRQSLKAFLHERAARQRSAGDSGVFNHCQKPSQSFLLSDARSLPDCEALIAPHVPFETQATPRP